MEMERWITLIGLLSIFGVGKITFIFSMRKNLNFQGNRGYFVVYWLNFNWSMGISPRSSVDIVKYYRTVRRLRKYIYMTYIYMAYKLDQPY